MLCTVCGLRSGADKVPLPSFNRFQANTVVRRVNYQHSLRSAFREVQVPGNQYKRVPCWSRSSGHFFQAARKGKLPAPGTLAIEHRQTFVYELREGGASA